MSDFRTVKLLRYVTPMDYFAMACEILFAGFVGYFVIEEIIEIRKHKLAYFAYIWNLLDIGVLIVSLFFKKGMRKISHP